MSATAARPLRYYLSRLLPPRQRYELVRRRCARRYESSLLTFPLEFERVRSVLLVMPEDLLQALYQVETVMALMARFASAHLTFLCRHDVGEYFRAIATGASFVEFRPEERYLYSPVLARYGESLEHEHFDVCVLLERTADLALLHIVGKTGAPARVGYAGCGGYPFVNHEVRPSPQHRSLVERNLALARAIGAPLPAGTRLTVPADAAAGVAQLLRELQVPPTAHLGLVDACHFVATQGPAWTAELLGQLRQQLPQLQWCCPALSATADAALTALRQQGAVVVPPLPVVRSAALVERCEVTLSGAAPLYRLACLQLRPCAGLFDQSQLDALFQPGEGRQPVAYSGTADSHAASALALAAQKLLAAPK
jgi:ADP-heptose:LPS heptosyltransferase